METTIMGLLVRSSIAAAIPAVALGQPNEFGAAKGARAHCVTCRARSLLHE